MGSLEERCREPREDAGRSLCVKGAKEIRVEHRQHLYKHLLHRVSVIMYAKVLPSSTPKGPTQ